MHAFQLRPSWHANFAGCQLNLLLYVCTHAHLRINQLPVSALILFTERYFGKRLFQRINPQIINRFQRIQLPPRFIAFFKLALHALDRHLNRLHLQRLIGLHGLHVAADVFDECLLALLAFAVRAKCGHI